MRPSIVLASLTLAATLLNAGCTQPATTAAAKPAEASASGTASPAASTPPTAPATSTTPTEPAADPTPEQPAVVGGTLKWRDLHLGDTEADERCQTWLGDPKVLARTFDLGSSGKLSWNGVGGQTRSVIMLCHLVDVNTGDYVINLQVHIDEPKYNLCSDNDPQCVEDDVFSLIWNSVLKERTDPALEPFMQAALTRIER